jgi:hypothetical protein
MRRAAASSQANPGADKVNWLQLTFLLYLSTRDKAEHQRSRPVLHQIFVGNKSSICYFTFQKRKEERVQVS